MSKPRMVNISRSTIGGTCQWPAVFWLGQGYNWVNFDFIGLELEFDKTTRMIELTMALLGFKCWVNIKLPGTDSKLERMMTRAKYSQTEAVAKVDGIEVHVAPDAQQAFDEIPPEQRERMLAEIAEHAKRLKAKAAKRGN